MNEYMGIDRLQNGEIGTVVRLNSVGDIRKRLLDIGLTENTEIRCVLTAPMGDPKAYLIHGTLMAIRKQDGREVLVKKQTRGGLPCNA